MNRSVRRVILVAVALLIVLVVFTVRLIGPQPVGRRSRTTAKTSNVASSTSALLPIPPTPTNRAAAAPGLPKLDLSALDQLRTKLRSLHRPEASRYIRTLLTSRTNAATGLTFKVGKDGWLSQAPTLRVFLLNEWAQVDPKAAAEYAKEILSSPDSSDEWALALRNYALVYTNSEARAFLQQKFREMIGQPAWRSDPSIGFLEAFDVAVRMGGTELLPDLAALMREKDARAVSHAAYLALDRLTINEPAAVLTQLQQQPEAMQGRELTRANFFARADSADPQQKAILETYLLNPEINPSELKTFAGLYPNANFMISENLLTPTITPNRDALVQRDRQALQTVQQWLADPRFARLQPQLSQIKQRLEVFLGQVEIRTSAP